MASTNFIDNQTIIVASWLNDVNNMTYNGVVLNGILNGPTTLALQTGGLNAITIDASQVVSIPNLGGSIKFSTGIFEVKNLISINYTITSGNNAESIGPMSVAPGRTVTVPSGSRWVVV
jgi:hypothetical protein